MTSTKNNPNEIFWLARYAHNQVAPLIEQAKEVEPSLHFNVQINFTAGHPVFKGNHLGVFVHWDRDGMFQYEPVLRDKAAVDAFAAKLAADVANLQPVTV